MNRIERFGLDLVVAASPWFDSNPEWSWLLAEPEDDRHERDASPTPR